MAGGKGALDAPQYQLVRKHLEAEQVAVAAKIEVLEDELAGCHKRKLWLSWLRRFQGRVAANDLSLEERRELLLGVLDSVDVHLDNPKTHRLVLNFNLQVTLDGDVPSGNARQGVRVDNGRSSVGVELQRLSPGKKNCGRALD